MGIWMYSLIMYRYTECMYVDQLIMYRHGYMDVLADNVQDGYMDVPADNVQAWVYGFTS